MHEAKRGWDSSFENFESTPKSTILDQLRNHYPDSSQPEISSWRKNVPALQKEIGEVIKFDINSSRLTAVLEYQLPMESRRVDALFLLNGSVLVIELKGKAFSTDADIDQAFGYARDLRNYHRDCHNREVTPILVPELSKSQCREERGVTVCSPDRLDKLTVKLNSEDNSKKIDATSFLSVDAYKPLPFLITAARELFLKKKPPQLWKSIAKTDNAVRTVRDIIAETHERQGKALVLLTGVPGAGKTLVGLRLVHEEALDSLVDKDHGPASIFLSGNGPLVQVLHHVLSVHGASGKTFVRPIKEYVKRLHKNRSLVPSEHVVIFDEAQRAHDASQVAHVHSEEITEEISEPELFIGFAERVSDWFVLVGLVEQGQEIHVGEEGGLQLWADAVKNSKSKHDWKVYGPPGISKVFRDTSCETSSHLSPNESIRSHFSLSLHKFVSELVRPEPNLHQLNPLAEE